MSYSGGGTLSFFVGNAFVGTLTHYCCGFFDGARHESGYWPDTAYFCRYCGEIWARGVFTFDFDYQPNDFPPWCVEERYCEKHGDGRLIKDSLLEVSDADLLRRELNIELNERS